MPVAKASSPAAIGAETCQKAYEANEPAPSASRDTAPPACDQATRSPAPIVSKPSAWDRIERQIAQHGGLDHSEHEAARKEREDRRPAGPRPCARTALMRGARRSGGRRVVEPAERAPS